MRERDIRILFVEHNSLLREGLSLLIQLRPDIELVATAAQTKEVLELFRAHKPDVTLMDLPFGDGVKAMQSSRESRRFYLS